MKRALITGITGQDGSYLAELLLEKGYEVHGIIRRSSSFNTERIDHIFDRLTLYHGDMCDEGSIRAAVRASKPDEVYNLAAQSHVRVSFDMPLYTADVAYLGAVRLFQAVHDLAPSARVYQASSSEMFGASPAPQNEDSKLTPQSPYAVAKCAAHLTARLYREAYGLHICCGILFNHESPRRGETFVTRKVCKAAARIKAGLQDELRMGYTGALRDWGYAGEYVEAMWLMLQQKQPVDLVIGRGLCYCVRDLLDMAFRHVGLNWKKYVKEDPKYMRPAEVQKLCADPARAKDSIGWQARMGFKEMVEMMVNAELERIK